MAKTEKTTQKRGRELEKGREIEGRVKEGVRGREKERGKVSGSERQIE